VAQRKTSLRKLANPDISPRNCSIENAKFSRGALSESGRTFNVSERDERILYVNLRS